MFKKKEGVSHGNLQPNFKIVVLDHAENLLFIIKRMELSDLQYGITVNYNCY
jgi:hypothetical protein